MAGKAAPEVVDEWSGVLTASRDRREQASNAYETADQEFRRNICGALEAGVPPRVVSVATGLTVGRLHQIRGGRRT
jgi:hypothetical protein